MTEIVFRGHDGPAASITIMQDDVPLDFSAITRMTLALRGHGVVADTDDDSTLIDWSAGDGVVRLALGALALPVGLHAATLVAYDALHANGQVLAHPSLSDAQLLIRVV